MTEDSEIAELARQALGLSPGERQAFLDAACAGNEELRGRVNLLLVTLVAPNHHDELAAGEFIGPYRILQKIGMGGMGEVFLAEQRVPIIRRVALKVVKRGMDSREVIARFNGERQALALMSHSNVASVLDAGVAETGRPYFVMEHVPGSSICDYADSKRMSIEQRIRLFIQACNGVHHAHQKGIIHRDLKPGNLLVTEKDGAPLLKVIDFGIAKSMHQKLAENTVYTELGMLIGTPNYMSPEQAGSGGLDIDTRTDVYALGVLLYELLVGALPFGSETFKGKSLGEIQRMICEIDPPPPISRLTFSEDSGQVARLRQTDLRNLRRQIKGDLTWIIQRSIEKDRDLRYPSAAALAEDLNRYLEHRPVEARRHGLLYQARKFVRRHRALVLATATVLFALTAALVQTLVSHQRVRDEAAMSAATNALLVDILSTADPNSPRNSDSRSILDVTQSLERSLDRGEVFTRSPELVHLHGIGKGPLLEVNLRMTIGSVYKGLGRWKESERNLGIAETLAVAHLGKGSALEQRAQVERAYSLWRLKRRDDALEKLEPLLALSNRELSGDQAQIVVTAHDYMYRIASDESFVEGLAWVEKALVLSEKWLGQNNSKSVDLMSRAADMNNLNGNSARALELSHRALKRAQELVPPNPSVAIEIKGMLGAQLADDPASNADEAISLLTEAVSQAEEFSGKDSRAARDATRLLSLGLAVRGFHARAIEIDRELKNAYVEVFGVDQWIVRQLDLTIICNLRRLDRLDEMTELHRRLSAVFKETGERSYTGSIDKCLAEALVQAGNPEAALPVARSAALEEDSARLAKFLSGIEEPLIVLGQYDEATEKLKRLANSGAQRFLLAHIALQKSDTATAKSLLEIAVAAGREPDGQVFGRADLLLAELELRAGNARRASELATQAMHRIAESVGDDHWWLVFGKLIQALADGTTDRPEMADFVAQLSSGKRPRTLEGQRAAGLIRDLLAPRRPDLPVAP